MDRSNSAGYWLEYLLIIILVVIIAVAAYKLFRPYIEQELLLVLCQEFDLEFMCPVE